MIAMLIHSLRCAGVLLLTLIVSPFELCGQDVAVTIVDSTTYAGDLESESADTIVIRLDDRLVARIPRAIIDRIDYYENRPRITVTMKSGIQYVGELLMESADTLRIWKRNGGMAIVSHSDIRSIDRTYGESFFGYGLTLVIPGLYYLVLEGGIGRLGLRFSGGGFFGYGCQLDLMARFSGTNEHGASFLLGIGTMTFIYDPGMDDLSFATDFIMGGLDLHLGGFNLLIGGGARHREREGAGARTSVRLCPSNLLTASGTMFDPFTVEPRSLSSRPSRSCLHSRSAANVLNRNAQPFIGGAMSVVARIVSFIILLLAVAAGTRLTAQTTRIVTTAGEEYLGELLVESIDTLILRSDGGIDIILPRSAVDEIEYEYGDRRGPFWSLGLTAGMPAGLNLVVERRFSDRLGVRVTGGYLWYAGGAEIDGLYRLGRSGTAEHHLLLGVGAMILRSHRYAINTYEPVIDDRQYVQTGYALHWGGFNAVAAVSIGFGDMVNPMPMLQVGYVHRFFVGP